MKIRLFIILLFILPSLVDAQLSTSSPYSRFGIGQMTSTNFSHLQYMGNLGASFKDAYLSNITNPASLASLRATAVDISIFSNFSTLNDGTNKNTSFNGNLEYISLAFPTKNPYNQLFEESSSDFSHGMAFTLMPHSIVGYDIISTSEVPNVGSVSEVSVGSGGTNKFIISNGVRYKKFSAGLNLGYVFGKIKYSQDVFFSELSNTYSIDYENNYSLSGFIWNLGLQYTLILNKSALKTIKGAAPKTLNFGLTYGSNTSINTNSNEINLNAQVINNFVFIDTVSVTENVAGKGTLPGEMNLGFHYSNGSKLTLGANYRMTFWDNYKNDASPNDELSNTSMLTFGGFYRPNYKSIDKYYQRVYYRFGFHYGNNPISIENKRVNDYGASLGFGLPFVFQKKLSHANIGFSYGKRGSGTAIEENIVRISFGFTFNDDEWFIKRKYN